MGNTGIPLINIASFLNGKDNEKHRVARQVGVACEGTGFLSIEGHGISSRLIAEAYALAQQFFELPLNDKMRLHVPGSGVAYLPPETESLAASTGVAAPGDLKESFNVKADPNKNIWPAHPDRLKPVWEAYFLEMVGLAQTLMRIFAVALGLPEHFFDDKVDHPKAVLRANHYPPLESIPLPGQYRAGAHTDYGTLTILKASSEQDGLQVLHRNGYWIDVTTRPGTFVINIGDLMMRWTNDHWKSTLHRVVIPSSDKARASSRLSLVFLHNPNPEVMVKCLDICCDTENPPKYEPVLTADYLRLKSKRSRELSITT